MAVSPVVPNAIQVRLIWLVGGEICINVLNFSATAAVVVNAAFANLVGGHIRAAFTAQWASHCATTTTLSKVGVRDLRVPNMPEFQDTAAASAGIGTSDGLPSTNAVCVTLRTAKAGRSFRGRVYVPGAAEVENTAGGVQSTATGTAAAAFINAIITNLQPDNLTMAVMSKPAEAFKIVKTTTHSDGSTSVKTLSNVGAKSGGLENVTATESRNTRWETQRRRGNGRGSSASLVNGPVARFEVAVL